MKKKKKGRLKIRVVILFALIIYILVSIIVKFTNTPITNFFISGNSYYNDWEIIKLAKLDDYPSTLKNSSNSIEKRLKKDSYIKSAKVYKKHFTTVVIEVEENTPLFYNLKNNKTILKDGTEIDKVEDVPTLYYDTIDLNLYNELLKAIGSLDSNILRKISEIKYYPDDVDKERFLLTMIDENYVYITINKFNLLNKYNEYVKEFNNKKGILYLNSGGYFKIMGN